MHIPYKENFELLGRNLKPIVLFEIIFALLTAVIVTPILVGLFHLSITLSGVGYVGNDNIISYLLHPTTILLVIIIIFGIALISVLNIISVIQAIDASHFDRDITVGQMFRDGFANARRVFSKKNWFIVIYTVLIVPLTGFVSVAGYAGTIQIPEFILDFIKNNTLLSIAAGILAVVLVVLALKWALCYQAFVFESEDFGQARAESSRLTKGHGASIFFDVIIWEFFLGLLLALISVIVATITVLITKMIWSGAQAYSASVTAVFVVGVTMSTLYGIFSVPLVFVHLSELFYRYKKEQGETLVYEEPKPFPVKGWVKTTFYVIIFALVAINAAGFIATNKGYISLRQDVTKLPQVSAHRGDSASAPENSLPAFQKAIDDGADWIELNVHQTKDGVVVVTHDADLNRIAGVDKNVYDLTYDELEQYDVGSWFSADYKDLHVATLDEAVKLCKGKIKLNIELKPTGHEENFEANVIKVLKDNNLQPNQCVLASLKLDALHALKKVDPRYKTLYIMSVALGDLTQITDVDDYSLESSFITEDTVAQVHKAGGRLFAWTVNNEENVDEMVACRVDNIITDDPVRTKEIISEDATTVAVEKFVNFFFDDKDQVLPTPSTSGVE